MRASELLGLPVLSPSGDVWGEVLDIRVVQDGPLLGAFAALRIQGFVVGRHSAGSRLGYDRHSQHGPWVVRQAVRWWLRDTWFLPWESASLGDDVVTSKVTDRQPVPEI